MTLYALLAIFGLSLLIPGLIKLFRSSSAKTWLIAESPDALNQYAYHGMMLGLGLVAFWCLIFKTPVCW